MKTAGMRVGTRLYLGFGLVLCMMVALIMVVLMRFADIGGISGKIIDKDWAKANAANTINALTRENARQTMQLFFTENGEQAAAIRSRIEVNKKIIADSIDALDRLIYLPEGRALLAKIKESRAAYVKSFTGVGKMLNEGRRDEAIKLFNGETIPLLDALQEHINAMSELQKRIVTESGADIRKSIESAYTMILMLSAAAIGIGVAAGVLITRKLLRQLGGEPGYAVEIADRIANGELAVNVETKKGDHTSLLFAIRKMRDSLAEIVSQVRAGTDTIVTASSQIAAGNLDLSSRTEQQASSLEETASSMEQLTGIVKSNADNARQANQLALSASEVAVKGGEVVSQVVDTMSSIHDSAKKIVDIIAVIDGIAFQTNILALNAAVEAARAGEQGKGFAVVASEVRGLAQRSAAAAKEIKLLIGDSVDKVEIGARLVDQAGNTMNDIVAGITRVTDIMGEITAASQEQASGIEQVNLAINQMDAATQQNAALVEESAATAASLQQQAASLMKVVNVFKLQAQDVEFAGDPAGSGAAADMKARAAPLRIAASSTPPSISAPRLQNRQRELAC